MSTTLDLHQNLFRFYQGQSPEQDVRAQMQDREQAAQVRAGVRVPLGESQLIMSGALSGRRFTPDHVLDHRERQGDVLLDLKPLQAVFARFAHGTGEGLFPYQDGSLTQLDLEHTQSSEVVAGIRLADAFEAQASTQHTRVQYDLPQNFLYDSQRHEQTFSLRYVSPLGSYAALGRMQAEQTYGHRDAQQIRDYDHAFQEREWFLDAEWHYSVKTYGSVHWGRVEREYALFSERNARLSNLIVRGTHHYSPKLRFDVQWWDRPFQIVDRSILYVQSRAVRVDMNYFASPKWRLNLSVLGQGSDRVLLPRVVAQLPEELRNSSAPEHLQRVGGGLSYLPDPALRLFLDGYVEQVQRPIDQLHQRHSIVRMGLEYTLENLPGAHQRLGLSRYLNNLSNADALR